MVEIEKVIEKQEQTHNAPLYTKFSWVFDDTDTVKGKYGIKPTIRSTINPEDRFKTVWTNIGDINEDLVGKQIKTRVRLQNTRKQGKKMLFVVMRDSSYTAQAVLFAEEGKISSQMIDFSSALPKEAIIDIEGTVVKANKPIESCTVSNYELSVETLFLVNDCISVLPFQLEDANRKNEKNQEDEVDKVEVEVPTNKEEKDGKKDKKKEKEDKKKEKEKEKAQIMVKSDTRFDNRVLDLRVLATQAMMKLQSGVGRLFRDYAFKNGFTEIHTPKLIAGASEGGTNVFKLKYFDRDACLAQSPQLYKQMAIIGGLERVIEIAPVFRAENSNTGRHLCEFTMLDLEMSFKEHYFEVIDTIWDLFVYIFDGMKTDYKHELNVIANQYPFELIEYAKKPVILTFHEGVELLKSKGIDQDVNEDLDTFNERRLGELVKEKYGTDFYFLHKYPKSARPFYTMRDPENPNFTNSYDAFIRGEEILSGAQRINEYDELYKSVCSYGINPETLKNYLDAFKLGAPPHGGCGIGLERIVKLFTGFGNVKRCCMFPRDPKRLTP